MIPMDTDLRPTATIDPLVSSQTQSQMPDQMQERLARLAERRTGATTGSQRTTAPTASKPAAGRKRHAAQGSRTAAVMMSVGVAAGLTGYFQRADAAAAAEAAAASSATASVAATDAGTVTQVLETSTGSTGTAAQTATDAASTDAASTDAATTDTAAAAAAATVSATGLADGTYTGATDTNKWGPVQVQITVSGGVITEVVALQTPDDDDKSVRINDEAVPILVSETLAAQSADVDSVSGATYTSDSYKVSLQSAIDLAKATAQQAAA